MAEKVPLGIGGLHFRIGSASDLAARMVEAATRPGLWEGLCASLPTPPTIEATVDRLLNLYAAEAAPQTVS
jgi:hypothetical protein